jgi:hypothetical protein
VPSTEPSATRVVLDLVGFFVLAISGALVAGRKGLDVFGVLVLAGTTGLGGGGLCAVWRLIALWRHWQAPVPTGPASV